MRFLAFEVSGETVGYMLNATAYRRFVEHIDDGAMDIRHRNTRGSLLN